MQSGTVIKPLVKLGREPADCWEWIGALSTLGYPSKTINGSTTTGQRWLYTQLFGPLPAALTVRMACGKRTCANPHHMTIVTLTEAQRGGDNTVLLPADVRDIQLAKKHRSHSMAKQLAERAGCTTQTIYDIWAGRSWRRRSTEAAINASLSRGGAEGDDFGLKR